MSAGDEPEIPEPLLRRLESLAAQARDRSARQAAGPGPRRASDPEPGDLFVLPATAELPLEWVVLERRSEPSGKLLVVPADTRPLAGSADVEVAAEAPGGPLTLRCRFAARLDARLFAPEHRSGAVGPEVVAEALRRCREVEAGEIAASSPLAEEVDVVPDYLDWLREVPARGRALALAAGKAEPEPVYAPLPRWGGAHRLAAVLAALAVGLSIWVFQLRGEVDRLSDPAIVPSGEIVLGGHVRGRTDVAVPQEASHVLLTLIVDPTLDLREGYLEIVDRSDKVVWRSPRVPLSAAGELKLVIPHRLLPSGDYRIRVYPESGFGAPSLVEESVRLETPE